MRRHRGIDAIASLQMPLTRRRFLIGCGAAMASSALACGGRREPSYDVCIIGSGFAGTFLGLRLVERGFKTVMLEAGGEPGAAREAASFGYTNSGAVEYPIAASRVIGLGGSSNHWSGLLTRMRAADFRTRSQFGLLSDWPIDYADLEPYYCESETLLAALGAAPVAGAEPARSCAYPFEREAARDLAVDLDDQSCRFFPVAQSDRNGDGSGPVRLIDREIPAFENAAGATLLRDRQVTRLVAAADGTVDHAQVISASGEPHAIRARHFVVAAGVVESARLLLLSQGGPDALRFASDHLGRFFHVHPLLESRRRLRVGTPVPDAIYQTSSLADRYREQGLNAADYQLVGSDRRGLGLRALVGTEARAENRVSLSPDRLDPAGAALPDLAFSYSDRDRATFEHCAEVLGRHAMQREGNMPYADSYRWHPAGTCRMASTPQEGVVDANNRVFGVNNLYVSGACTFPSSGIANPTDTVVALTLRLADHLSVQLGG